MASAARRSACASIPTSTPKTHPYISTGLKGNKFGVAHDRAVAVYRRAAALPGIEVVGIDCHIGSQITDGAPYLDALDRLLDLVEAVERDGIALQHIDLGGGLGIPYTDETPPAADALIGAAARAHRRARPRRSARSWSSPAARWSATPACCVDARCSTSSPARRRTSASSTRR